MHIASRAASRLAFAGWLSLAGLLTATTASRAAATPAEKVLPATTFGLIKIENAAALRESVDKSQVGQLLDDPAMKPLIDDIASKMGDADKELKEKLGVTVKQLFELPEGQVYIALIARDDPKFPLSIVVSADAGKNAGTMQDVMTKATKEAEGEKAKVSYENYQGLKLTIIKSTKDEDKDDPPLIWTSKEGTYFVSTDLAALKDVLGNAKGRSGDSLGSTEAYQATVKKLGKDTQVSVYLDFAQVFKVFSQVGAAQGANAQQFEAILQLTGLNSLKSAGFAISFNVGEYDRLIKGFLYSPGASQGVQKIFQMPKVALKPQPWVPASAASYQSISWDLDNAYTAINDLADMFAPGALANVEKQLAGPNGNGLKFKEDVFGPLGDRVTIISDFKKPVTDKSQRALFGIALEDPKAFQDTLNKIFAMANAAPKKRDFQGTTIYDIALPKNVGQEGMNVDLPDSVSIAVAKETLFLATDASLLEQVLRPGGASLAELPAYQAVAKLLPAQTSAVSYQKPDEQARILYDAVKGGQLKKAIEGAQAAAGPGGGNAKDLIDPAKLPDFSVFAKYLSQGGGYAIQDEDGVIYQNFSLKKRSEP